MKIDYQRILNLATGSEEFTFADTGIHGSTWCISSEPFSLQVDSDGVTRSYMYCVRMLRIKGVIRSLYLMAIGVNVLDRFPDNSSHLPQELKNEEIIIQILIEAGYKLDLKN